ncbi:hypothetical protein CRUP_002788, partial [Coryphaenoides rupestris]
RYTVSMEFVRRFERQCSSQASVKRLRVHPTYTGFQNKWNLPVYFQLRTPATEVTKEPTRPLPSSASSTSSRTSLDEAGSDSGHPASLSTKQLVYIAADVQKLQEQIPDLTEIVRKRLEAVGFKNFTVLEAALEDSKASLSGSTPTLNSRMTQHLSERCSRYLKSASEVPRLYRRTNK